MNKPEISKFARLKLAIRQGDTSGTATGVQGDSVPEHSLRMDRSLRRRISTGRAAIVATTVLVAAILAAACYARYGLTKSLSMDAERLVIASVRRTVFQEYVPVTGSIVPARTIYLDAVEGGQVTQVHAEEGRMVEAGQPLLELKNTDLQLRLVEAQARLAEQVNNVNLRRLQVEQTDLQLQERLIGINEQIVTLERDLARNEHLLPAGTVAAKTVEDLRNALDGQRSLRATVLEAQRVNRDLQTRQTAQMQKSVDAIATNLDVARENLANLVMRAPISGQLTVFEAEVGEAKARGQRIGQIDGAGQFRVSALIDEFYLGRVTVGQAARVHIGGADLTLEVTKVYPNVRERQFQVGMEFAAGQPAGLRRGQALRMNLEIGAQTTSLVVANGPWVDSSGGVWAFVLSPGGGEARRRRISIGRRNPDMVEVTDGLREGERLIVSSYAGIDEFERIDIRGTPK